MNKVQELIGHIHWLKSRGLELSEIKISPSFMKRIRQGLGYEVESNKESTKAHMTFMGIPTKVDLLIDGNYEITVEG